MRPLTFSGGGGHRLRSYFDVAAHQARVSRQAARIAYDAWKRHQLDLPAGGRVLEIGCGSRAGTIILHHNAGAVATGIDYDDPRCGIRGVIGQLRKNGPERAVKTAGRRLLFDRTFYRELESLYGARLERHKVDLRPMDARQLAFQDGEFDLIYSIAVFEHIDGVDQAAAEISRVLKPDGVALIHAHLYYSLSGGHNLAWADASRPPSKPPAWDHLRGQTQPSHVFLNRLRGQDFLNIFSRHLAIEEYRYDTEGEGLVTDEILEETGVSRDDLTRASLTMRLHRK